MIKSFLLKQVLKSKLKNVPEAEREKIFAIIDTKPELIEQIAREVQGRVSQGMDQTSAMMEVMKKHEVEVRDLMK